MPSHAHKANKNYKAEQEKGKVYYFFIATSPQIAPRGCPHTREAGTEPTVPDYSRHSLGLSAHPHMLLAMVQVLQIKKKKLHLGFLFNFFFNKTL